jgi:hypothetical protein
VCARISERVFEKEDSKKPDSWEVIAEDIRCVSTHVVRNGNDLGDWHSVAPGATGIRAEVFGARSRRLGVLRSDMLARNYERPSSEAVAADDMKDKAAEKSIIRAEVYDLLMVAGGFPGTAGHPSCPPGRPVHSASMPPARAISRSLQKVAGSEDSHPAKFDLRWGLARGGAKRGGLFSDLDSTSRAPLLTRRKLPCFPTS